MKTEGVSKPYECSRCGDAFLQISNAYNICSKCSKHTLDVEGISFDSRYGPAKLAFAKPDHGHDPVNHPKHYTNHPSGVECIQITRHMGFNLGNAFKYIWRADMKNGIEDLEKAVWYLQDEIKKRAEKK